MLHLKSFRTLNRTHAHRKALYKNMLQAFFKRERIKTTIHKAKEIRRVAEKFITRAKVKNLSNIRLVAKLIKDKIVLKKLFDDIAPRFLDRKGGYTRIIRLKRRPGDGAEWAYLELVGEIIEKKKKKKKKVEEKIEQKDDVKQEVAVKKETEKAEEKEEIKESKEEAKVEKQEEIKEDKIEEDKK
jgi:large subunit ribosomal protein L17